MHHKYMLGQKSNLLSLKLIWITNTFKVKIRKKFLGSHGINFCDRLEGGQKQPNLVRDSAGW